MANRWQVMKKTSEGVFRATTNRPETLEELVKIAQNDEATLWIVVKDRRLNRREMVWRRSQGVDIAWYWLEPETPQIEFRQPKGIDKPRR